MAHVVAAAAVNSGDFMKWKTDCSNAVGFFCPKESGGVFEAGAVAGRKRSLCFSRMGLVMCS
jgi:hypothetical protein